MGTPSYSSDTSKDRSVAETVKDAARHSIGDAKTSSWIANSQPQTALDPTTSIISPRRVAVSRGTDLPIPGGAPAPDARPMVAVRAKQLQWPHTPGTRARRFGTPSSRRGGWSEGRQRLSTGKEE
jgi:hypothetical protein